jgi:hypothetical protein
MTTEKKIVVQTPIYPALTDGETPKKHINPKALAVGDLVRFPKTPATTKNYFGNKGYEIFIESIHLEMGRKFVNLVGRGNLGKNVMVREIYDSDAGGYFVFYDGDKHRRVPLYFEWTPGTEFVVGQLEPSAPRLPIEGASADSTPKEDPPDNAPEGDPPTAEQQPAPAMSAEQDGILNFLLGLKYNEENLVIFPNEAVMLVTVRLPQNIKRL